jgi:hypothetical protein
MDLHGQIYRMMVNKAVNNFIIPMNTTLRPLRELINTRSRLLHRHFIYFFRDEFIETKNDRTIPADQ